MPLECASLWELMTGNLDAFCERCGKTAVPPVPVGAAAGGSRMLRRLGLGGRSASSDGTAALRLCLGCRGYICSDCWNDDAAVCQSCQPLAGFGVSAPAVVAEEEAPVDLKLLDYARAEPDSMPLAWPASDLYREPGLTEEPVGAAEPPSALIQLPDEFAAGADPTAEAEFEPTAEFEPAAEFEPPQESEPVHGDMAEEPAATADSFEDRWAEILGRVQAVGTSTSVEPVAPESDPAGHRESEPVEADEAAPTLEASVVDQSAVEASVVDGAVFGQSAVEFELVADVDEAAQEEPVAVESVDEEIALIEEPAAAAEEHVDAEEHVAAAEELAAADQESAAVAEEPVAVAEELAAAAHEPAFTVDEFVETQNVEDEFTAVTEEPAPTLVDEPAPAAAESGNDVADRPAAGSTDPEEDLWAAVLHDADADVDSERPEPDSQELARLLQPRRLRRRVPKPLSRRPLRLPAQPEPATIAPTISFAADAPQQPVTKSAPETALPVEVRSLKLPPALPPQPSALTQPWPMPAPPAFLPPPPPAMSTIQPAPARFRPQNAPIEQPKPPSTRPCGTCGLELSAKVTFCRRCGTRQPPAA
jgi:hypothetical protein